MCAGATLCVWRYICHNSSACHAYVKWEELHVNNWANKMGIKIFFKWNVHLGFCLAFSLLNDTTITLLKVSLFATWMQSTVSFSV